MITMKSSELDSRSAYFLMTSLVVPRPIAWISTLASDGKRNLAPYSHFNNCSANPPIIMFCSNGEKHTLRNIRATGEFVLNMVSDDMKLPMRISAANWPYEVDEFEKAGLATVPSSFVKPQRIANAKAAIECTLRQIIPMGEGSVIFGDIQCFHVAEDVWVDGRVDPEKLKPVGKLSGSIYSTVHKVERIDLPEALADQVQDYGRKT